MVHVKVARMARSILKDGEGQAYRGVPADERRRRRRDRLIEAAISVYGERGVRGATVKAVCEAARLTERYFYENFQNSEALLVAAYDAVNDHVFAQVEEASASERAGPPRVRAIIEAYCRRLDEDRVNARFFVVELGGAGGEIGAVLDRALLRFGDLLESAWGPRHAPADPLLRLGVMGGLNRMSRAWVASEFERPVGAIVATSLVLAELLAPPPG